MRATLRMWMGSWQLWVIVACLAYIVGIRGQGSRIVAIWPSGLWVAEGLLAVALLVLSWFALKYIVVPYLMFLQGDKSGRRTAKAKEKLADSLMSFGTAVLSTIVISVMVFPLTAFVQAIARGTDPVEVVVSRWPPAWLSWWHTGAFLILFWVPFNMAMLFRRRALDLYDELSPPAPAVALTTQGTPERPNVPAEVPPAPSYEVTPHGPCAFLPPPPLPLPFFAAWRSPTWLPVAQRPEGSMLLYHLQRHLDQAGPYLRRMETECIDAVLGELFALVEVP